MATIYNNLSNYDPETVPSGKGKRVQIIVSEWNSEVTEALRQGAYDTLIRHGVAAEDIAVTHVPGSFELIYATARVVKHRAASSTVQGVTAAFDAVIAIGCIVRGDTPHFDYISESVGNNLGALNVEGVIPVIFGVLTTDTMQQALDRAGGKHGNKGDEAGVTALKMMAL